MPKKTFYINDESEELWYNKFNKGGENASAWIQARLKEDKENDFDVKYLNIKLLTLQRQSQKLNDQIGEIKLKIQDANKLNKEKTLKSEETIIIQPTPQHSIFMQKLMAHFGFDKKKAKIVANEYLSISPEKRPDEIKFIDNYR